MSGAGGPGAVQKLWYRKDHASLQHIEMCIDASCKKRMQERREPESRVTDGTVTEDLVR